mmetsp:Transcript_107297/g.331515  ORF Transcript_107297/g.331515 Transcript_107297/m.331515 type:complete len:331 (+) Transcript_107297:1-993(+)
MESLLATPDNSAIVDSDEELGGTAHTDASVATQVAQVPLPAEWQEPPPPGAGPPTSNSMLTALFAGNADSQPRVPRRNRRRGKPPLLVGQEASDAQEVASPKRPIHSGSGHASSSHAPPPAEQPPLHTGCLALPEGRGSGQAHLAAAAAARSVSPSRPTNPKPPEEPPALAVIRSSGSAPSLPPLPPLLAPQRDRVSRSRSVVALHEPGQQERRGHGEAFQPLQRPLFRTTPLRMESEGVGTSSQGSLPLAPPPPQQSPPQRQAARDESGPARLAHRLPTAVAGQSESRHWREPAAPALGRLVHTAVREGWGDGADADARLPGTARLSVV